MDTHFLRKVANPSTLSLAPTRRWTENEAPAKSVEPCNAEKESVTGRGQAAHGPARSRAPRAISGTRKFSERKKVARERRGGAHHRRQGVRISPREPDQVFPRDCRALDAPLFLRYFFFLPTPLIRSCLCARLFDDVAALGLCVLPESLFHPLIEELP